MKHKPAAAALAITAACTLAAHQARPARAVILTRELNDGRIELERVQPGGDAVTRVLSRAEATVLRHFLYPPPDLRPIDPPD